MGRFVPQCAADGSYEEVQCYGSTGYCWCADVGGNPVLGTITRGMPHCNKTALGGENILGYQAFIISSFVTKVSISSIVSINSIHVYF